jgi:energy-coupling factor transport system ATP-binding protein
VSIASILAMNPACLILDEPTAGQDQAGIDLMAEIVRRQGQAAGKTVLAITHDMDFCAANFERILVMHQGRLVFDGPILTALAEPAILLEAGMDLPQLQRLGLALGLARPVRDQDEFLQAYRQWKKSNS